LSLKSSLLPYLARAITSPRTRDFKRRLRETGRMMRGGKHVVTFYFRIDDPYSWLLAQLLPEFEAHFGIKIQPRTMLYLDESLYPALDQLRDLAPIDCARLAALHDLNFPLNWTQPDNKACVQASQILLQHEKSDKYFSLAEQLSEALWSGKPEKVEFLLRRYDAETSDKAALQLQARRDHFVKDGHYLTATLHYAGEWYWGIDRLDHLTERLARLGLGNGVAPRQYGIAKRASLKSAIKHGASEQTNRKLEMFFSFRSPYSYIALARTYQLAEHYQLDLTVRPVLPMVMRGLSVPNAKKFYILKDAAREAAVQNVPFGFVCDPVGSGVERCMALWPFAEKEQREREYFIAAGRCIWSQGIDVSTDEGLASVCKEAGLDWNRARRWLDDNGWRERAEQNRTDMMTRGSWGVPTFSINKQTVWGQDRFAIIESIILQGEPL
tara:strand:- start:108083 stop:109402 length:1320 start_codon:yes stop_codon:yes gene_type:complete